MQDTQKANNNATIKLKIAYKNAFPFDFLLLLLSRKKCIEKTGTTNTWSSSCCCKDTSCDVSGQIWQEVHNCATQQLVLENMRGVIDNNNNTNRNNYNNTGYVKFWHISITKSVFPRKGAFRLDIEMHYQQR